MDKIINYTIIIPHYNIPDLLMRCLKSIPVREDIQVIVIDDCSPGAEKYLEKYPELSRPYLELLKTPIGGCAGRARNIGLDHARGKWIICMDADDLFESNIEEILDESLNKEEDILFYKYKTVYSNDITKEAHRNYYYALFDKYNRREEQFRYEFDPMWGKIFRREMIEKYHIRCDELRYGNDAAFSFKCGAYARKIAIFDKIFFLITERENSLSSSDFSKKKISKEECEIRLQGAINIHQFVLEEGIKTKHRAHIWRACTYFNEYPIEFIKFYYNVLLKKNFRISLSLPFQMFISTTIGRLYHSLQKRS